MMQLLKKTILLFFLLSNYLVAGAVAQNQEERLHVVGVTPAVDTRMDFSPWLDDNLSNLVKNVNDAYSNEYIDVTLQLERRATITKVLLYNQGGNFKSAPVEVYALSGATKILLGTYTGEQSRAFTTLDVNGVTAEAIVVRKKGNNVPGKVRVYGTLEDNSLAEVGIPAIANARRIEAEAYSSMKSVRTENVNDEGGAVALTNLTPNSWMKYAVALNAGSSYTFSFRVSSTSGGEFEIRDDRGTVLETVNVASTNGWNNWTTFTVSVTAPVASQSIEFYVNRPGWRLNWFEVAGPANATAKKRATIDFEELPVKTVGDAPIELVAVSDNTLSAIEFSSSDQNVVAVTKENGKWKATAVAAGTAEVTASQPEAGEFAATATSQAVTVKGPANKTQTVIEFAEIPAKIVGDNAFELLVTSNNDETAITLKSSNTAVLSVAKTGTTWMATVVGVGTANITASQTGNKNFISADNVVRTATVQAAPVDRMPSIIAFAALPVKTVGDAAFDLVANSTNTSTPITFSSSDPAVVSVALTDGKWRATIVAAGSATITASQDGDADYLPAASVAREQVVQPAPVVKVQSVISFAALAAKTFGDAPFELVATSNNTETPITFVSSNPGVVALSEANGTWTATILSGGTVTITASQAGNEKYLAAASITREQVVQKIQAVISFEALPTKTVGDAAYELVATSNNTATPVTFVSSNPAVVAVANTNGKWMATVVSAGAATITASQAANANYSAAANVAQVQEVQPAPIVKVKAVISFDALPARTVGDAAYELKATSTNTGTPIAFASSNPAVVSVSNTNGTWIAKVLAAGTANITASQAGNENYLAADDVTRVQEVQPAPIVKVQAVISFAALPAKTVGDAAFELKATSNNTATPITFTSSNPGVVAVANTNGRWMATVVAAGTANITASQAGNENYLAAADVVQAQVVQQPAKIQAVITFAPPAEKTVGDAPFELIASSNNNETPITFTSSKPNVIKVENVSGRWMATILESGIVTITASQAGNTKYEAAAPVAKSITVMPAPIVVPTVPPGERKSGVLTLDDYSLTNVYLAGPKAEADNYRKLFDGVLNEKVTMTWSSTLATNYLWITFPEQMDMKLEKLRIYDGDGTFSPAVKFHYIKRDATKPGGIDWTKVPGPVFSGPERLLWKDFPLATPLDIYAIVIEMKQILPGEIQIIGSWNQYTPEPYKIKQASIGSSLKVNGYIWNVQQVSGRPIDEHKMNLFKSFTGVRDYIDWTKVEKVKGEYTFEPASEGGWKYDMVYERMIKEGIDIHACFKNNTPWSLQEFGYPENNYEFAVAPWTKLPNTDPNYHDDIIRLREDPRSYILYSKAAFQYAARYGSNKNLDPNLVSVSGNQQKKIGLDYVKTIECNNETDAAWHGRMRYMTPREYAYLLSVFYDGHMNTMGPGVGIKNADPNMLVVAGGLADNKPTYFQGVIEAWKEIRGYKKDANGNMVVNMACDIWNFHAYANNGGGQHMNGSHGLPPELSNMPVRIKNFMQIISEVGQDLPVWITEVGYGVNEGSQQALATPTRTKLQTHGDWTIRTALFNLRNGVAETYFYQAYDESSYTLNVSKGITDNRTYAACGMMNEELTSTGRIITKRPAAHYLTQMQLFKDFVYQKTISENPFVDVFDYNGKKMYALTVPDMVGRTEKYTLDLGSATQATIYTFADGVDEFSKQVVNTVGGKLTVTVTEAPSFVVAGADLSATNTQESFSTALEEKGSTLLAYPNPFTSETKLAFTLEHAGEATLELYDLRGTLVRKLYTGSAAAGEQQEVTLKAQGLAKGIYLVKMVTGSKVITQKIMLTN